MVNLEAWQVQHWPVTRTRHLTRPTRPVAVRIVEAREAAPITTTSQLVAAVGQTVFRDRRGGGGRGGRQIHPATRTFQVGEVAARPAAKPPPVHCRHASPQRPATQLRAFSFLCAAMLLPPPHPPTPTTRRDTHTRTPPPTPASSRPPQALRIAVNDELRQLAGALPAALACLAPGGRLAVISFHSLEDRIVKRALARAAGRPTPEDEADTHGPGGAEALEALRAAAIGEVVLRRPVTAGPEEVAANPRARSAKLRVFERAGGQGSGDGGSGTVWRGSKRRRREAELQRLQQQQGGEAPGGSEQ